MHILIQVFGEDGNEKFGLVGNVRKDGDCKAKVMNTVAKFKNWIEEDPTAERKRDEENEIDSDDDTDDGDEPFLGMAEESHEAESSLSGDTDNSQGVADSIQSD